MWCGGRGGAGDRREPGPGSRAVGGTLHARSAAPQWPDSAQWRPCARRCSLPGLKYNLFSNTRTHYIHDIRFTAAGAACEVRGGGEWGSPLACSTHHTQRLVARARAACGRSPDTTPRLTAQPLHVERGRAAAPLDLSPSLHEPRSPSVRVLVVHRPRHPVQASARCGRRVGVHRPTHGAARRACL